ncbi:MAG TPA: type II toxin-antitoxin system RelE/ParE family toxin [Thermoanaerobaculia bacterium]|nr:type II toxin-antitoxin system RelE/ParE family toxin [Thermoanaerobaculia bacterium]
MSRFVLTPAARADLTEIFNYISQDSPDSARRVLDELRGAMRKLSQMPEIGHYRQDLADEPLRFWPVYSYLIIYRFELRPLQVVRVLHGARDVRSILEET